MSVDAFSLRADAQRIWQAGVDAVRSDRLVQDAIEVKPDSVEICGHRWTPGSSGRGRILVVGAGKAGGGMAAGLEAALSGTWLDRTSGWVNVPADCVRPLSKIHLHPARPAGVNEPTPEGVQGTNEILRQVGSLTSDDLCIVLISGGGSALLPAPRPGLSLDDKQSITRLLMRRGAEIGELNCVRRNLSSVKGGGLLRACRAGLVIALIISDVVGDPLETIASGPTVPIDESPQAARAILEKYDPGLANIPEQVLRVLESASTSPSAEHPLPPCYNEIIGRNETAVAAAQREAERLGYDVVATESGQTGVAREVGAELAEWAIQQAATADTGSRQCRLSGGEPTVTLVETNHPQKGGRNQELALAALLPLQGHPDAGVVILSGGTDGEDGPTDAAGALADAGILTAARERGLDPEEFLKWNNSYPFFEQTGGLIKTGPTSTNVMDLRVVLVAR